MAHPIPSNPHGLGFITMNYVVAAPVTIVRPAVIYLAHHSIPVTAHNRHQLSLVRAYHRATYVTAMHSFDRFQSQTNRRTPIDIVSNFFMPYRRSARIRLLQTAVARAREYTAWCQRQLPLWRGDSVEAAMLRVWLFDEALGFYEHAQRLLAATRQFRADRECIYGWLRLIGAEVRLSQTEKPQWKRREDFATMRKISRAADGHTVRKSGWEVRARFWSLAGKVSKAKERVTGNKKSKAVTMEDLHLVAPPPTEQSN